MVEAATRLRVLAACNWRDGSGSAGCTARADAVEALTGQRARLASGSR
ncbi:MAG: hypothetical protein R3E70_13670 [Burkholderiaceae bacterium]